MEYGICKHSHCRKFRLETSQRNDNQVHIIVGFDKGDDNHIGEEYAYRLGGKKRKVEKLRLLKELPSSVRHYHIEHGDMKAFQEGNWQNVRSLSVYQKARSEAKAESDFHQDSFIDLRLKSIQQTKGTEYIQFLDGREPKYFYSKDQINILVGRGKQIDVFFDATGSVLFKLESMK